MPIERTLSFNFHHELYIFGKFDRIEGLLICVWFHYLRGKISPPPQPIFSKTLKSHVWKQNDHNSAHPKLSSDTKETMSHKALLQNCILLHFSQNGSWTRIICQKYYCQILSPNILYVFRK